MKPLLHFLAGALLVGASLPTFAEAPGPYDDFIKQVQQKLNELGFDAGPVNGDFGFQTQAALAQFQIANLLPASGSLDDGTLHELDIQRPTIGAEAVAPPGFGNAGAGGTAAETR